MRHFGAILGCKMCVFPYVFHYFLRIRVFALKSFPKASWSPICTNLAPQERPRDPQEAPKSAPERPKREPRAAKSGPRAAQERPKSSQERPKSDQERPKSGQERPKGEPELLEFRVSGIYTVDGRNSSLKKKAAPSAARRVVSPTRTSLNNSRYFKSLEGRNFRRKSLGGVTLWAMTAAPPQGLSLSWLSRTPQDRQHTCAHLPLKHWQT